MHKKGVCLAYNTKIIETPTTKEFWIYERPISRELTEITDNQSNHTEKKTRRKFDNLSAIEQGNSLQRKQKYYEQKRWDIARLIDCNFDTNTKFITLTFKDNIQDIDYSNTQFKYFIQRLNYYLFKEKSQKLKYIATWEKQQRGAIHYHVVFFDFPYIKAEDLQRLWGHGFIKINRIQVDRRENVGRYISKYFGKDLDLKEHKKKAFFKSQNLKIPAIHKTFYTEDMIQALEEENIIFQKEYERIVYDSHSFVKTGSPFITSSVRYIKVKKEILPEGRGSDG